MPRIVALCVCLVGGCFFDAEYRSGSVRCSDGKCPSGLTCRAEVCVDPRFDAAVDMMIDARPAALTCNDPAPFPATGGTTAGSTATRSSTVSAMCSGFVMNGPDAVYRIDTASGATINLTISGSYQVNAYVIAPCSVAPATPMCIGNVMAAMNTPVNVTTTFAGQHFIIVDGPNAGMSGDYTLTVAAN